MGLANSVKLLGAGMLWRSAKVESAGRALAKALEGDEQERTLAGIGLVQAGSRSVEPIEAEYQAHGPSKTMVRVLSDIEGRESTGLLSRIAADDHESAELARKAVERRQQSDP